MTTKIQCHHCGTPLEFESDLASEPHVKCPACGQLTWLKLPATLVKCATCLKMISRNARSCPHCGEPWKPFAPEIFYIAAILFTIIAVLAVVGTFLLILTLPH